MSRLINCLNGFDPLVNIQIADNEQIAQVIEVIRVGLERENKYDLELHIKSTKFLKMIKIFIRLCNNFTTVSIISY